jgi:hypothetical protein
VFLLFWGHRFFFLQKSIAEVLDGLYLLSRFLVGLSIGSTSRRLDDYREERLEC